MTVIGIVIICVNLQEYPSLALPVASCRWCAKFQCQSFNIALYFFFVYSPAVAELTYSETAPSKRGRRCCNFPGKECEVAKERQVPVPPTSNVLQCSCQMRWRWTARDAVKYRPRRLFCGWRSLAGCHRLLSCVTILMIRFLTQYLKNQ